MQKKINFESLEEILIKFECKEINFDPLEEILIKF